MRMESRTADETDGDVTMITTRMLSVPLRYVSGEPS